MIRNTHTIISILILLFSFTQNSYANDEQSKHREQLEYIEGINDARKSPTTVHQAYLMCYARKDKVVCHEEMTPHKDSYNQELLSSKLYLTGFLFEAERLGFLGFLQNNNLPCDAVDEGPLYKEDVKAYEVVCRNGNKYHMQFDYKTFLWSLKSD